MTSPRTALLVIGALLCCLSALVGCSGNSAPKEEDPGAKAPPKGFIVVQIDEDIRVIPKAGLPALREELKHEYEQAMARYQQEQQAAEKSGTPFDKSAPLPRKPRVSKDTYATEDAANAYREKLLSKIKAAAGKSAPAPKASEPAAEPKPEPEEESDEGGRA